MGIIESILFRFGYIKRKPLDEVEDNDTWAPPPARSTVSIPTNVSDTTVLTAHPPPIPRRTPTEIAAEIQRVEALVKTPVFAPEVPVGSDTHTGTRPSLASPNADTINCATHVDRPQVVAAASTSPTAAKDSSYAQIPRRRRVPRSLEPNAHANTELDKMPTNDDEWEWQIALARARTRSDAQDAPAPSSPARSAGTSSIDECWDDGWRDEDFEKQPPPPPGRIVRTTSKERHPERRSDNLASGANNDEWEWQIALARARTRSEESDTPTRRLARGTNSHQTSAEDQCPQTQSQSHVGDRESE